MLNDYASLFLAVLLGYQLAAPLWHGSRRSGLNLLAPLSSLAVLGLLPEISFTGLRIGWVLSGGLLCYQAVARMQRGNRVRPALLSVLDGAGAWAALVLAGSSALAILAGALAGIALAVAMGPRPPWLERMLEPGECILMGAVGLRSLMAAGLGPTWETWPILLMAVPWLMLWGVAGEPTSLPPIQ